MQTNKKQKSMFSLLLKIYTTVFLLVGIAALLAVTSCAPLELLKLGTYTNEPDLTESNQSNEEWIEQSNQSNDAWTTSNEAWLEKSNQSNDLWIVESNQSNEEWIEQSNQSNTEWTTSNDAWLVQSNEEWIEQSNQSNQSNTEWTTSNDAWLVQSNEEWIEQSNQSNTEWTTSNDAWLVQSNEEWIEQSNQSNTEWTTSNDAWLVQSNEEWIEQSNQSNTEWTTSNDAWLVQSNIDYQNSQTNNGPVTSADVSEANCTNVDAGLDCFISKWDTSKPAVGADTTANKIVLPLITSENAGLYDFYVDWGDGTVEHITGNTATHTYATNNEYTVYIAGTIEGFSFGTGYRSAKQLTDITQWGSLVILNDPSAKGIFEGAENFVGTATDAPDVSKATSLASAFEGASSFNGVVNDWDVSQVTTMDSMFRDAEKFNQPVGGWDVLQVTNMNSMFRNARAFDQDLTTWTIHLNLSYSGFYLGGRISAKNRHQWMD